MSEQSETSLIIATLNRMEGKLDDISAELSDHSSRISSLEVSRSAADQGLTEQRQLSVTMDTRLREVETFATRGKIVIAAIASAISIIVTGLVEWLARKFSSQH